MSEAVVVHASSIARVASPRLGSRADFPWRGAKSMLATMKPVDICKHYLGKERVDAILEELSSPQIKAVLKEGDVKLKTTAGYVSQQKKREQSAAKIRSGIEAGNQALAAELLQQWLLNHRRALLIAYLDRLEVKHRQGETDESFLIARPAEKVREAATWLLEQSGQERAEVQAYLLYIAHQQRASVFDEWEPLRKPATGTPPPASAEPQPASPAAGS